MALDIRNQERVVALLDSGKSQLEIALKLGISQATVSRIKKKLDKNLSLDRVKGSGRPYKLSYDQSNKILEIWTKKPNLSLRKVVIEATEVCGKDVSHMNIKNLYNSHELYAHSPSKKPLLTKKHIEARYKAAESWLQLENNDLKQ